MKHSFTREKEEEMINTKTLRKLVFIASIVLIAAMLFGCTPKATEAPTEAAPTKEAPTEVASHL